MAGRVVLHIGAMKTGTSYLQSVLGSNPTALEDAGFTFLGGKFGIQARAVRDVLNLPKAPQKNKVRWAALADEAQKLDGRTGIVSMEFLSFAGPRHVRAFLEPLQGLEVEVILTVRDQFRVIPAQWQTYTRNFGQDDWESYLRHIEPSKFSREKSRAHRTFHRAQDVLPTLDRWCATGQVSATHVMTVPAPGAAREELWHRFRSATGIPEVAVDVEAVHENESLGFGSCDFLRRVNVHLQDVPARRYRKGMRAVASAALVPRRGSESRPELDLRGAKYARALNEELRAGISDRLSATGARLSGTLDDLPVPDDLSAFPRNAPAVPVDEVDGAARAVWSHLAAQLGEVDRTSPSGLDAVVEDSANMLRAVNRWGGRR
jgi:hypothetical protein